MKSSSFVPGRVYSVVYDAPVEMVAVRDVTITSDKATDKELALAGFGDHVKIAQQGYAPKDVTLTIERSNPFIDIPVTVRRVSTVQAAGEKTWANFKRRTNPDWQPSGNRKNWYHVTDNSCIVQHNSNGTRYLRGLPRGVSKEQYFIGGTPATEAQVETIKAFAKNAGKPQDYVLLSLDNLANVTDEGGEKE